VSVAPQVPAGDKGRNPGGGGGEGNAEVLRSRFRTTAFFLGSVVTDSAGRGSATVTLPDNLTTFRVMAVAVTAGDRFGNGQSPLLVTRPLLAAGAAGCPPGDRFTASVVVNPGWAAPRSGHCAVAVRARQAGRPSPWPAK
jgi:uncharacterized protein YfaS (alpha-2-macroglobulin family)